MRERENEMLVHDNMIQQQFFHVLDDVEPVVKLTPCQDPCYQYAAVPYD